MKNLYRIAAAALCLFAAGCLVSGTFLVEVDFVDVDTDFTNGLVKEVVALSDYTDRSEDIQRIERLDFDAIVENDVTPASAIDVYVSADSTYTTRAQVKAAGNVYPVLLGYVTKPGPSTDTLTITEARALLQLTGTNWETIKTLVETGTFCVYVTSTAATVQGRIVKANIFITLTAKP